MKIVPLDETKKRILADRAQREAKNKSVFESMTRPLPVRRHAKTVFGTGRGRPVY
jgi:hypothetical protein